MNLVTLSCLLGIAPLASAQGTCAVVTAHESVSSSGLPGDSHSESPSLSHDGLWLAFSSEATNLVAADTNGYDDVFVRNLASGTTELISLSTAGAQGGGHSHSPEISPDGSCVVFSSGAPNLVSGDTNNRVDIFVRDLAAGTTERVSLGASGGQPTYDCEDPCISFDGRYVAFSSQAPLLTAIADTNNRADIFVRDRVTNTTTMVSVDSAGWQGAYDALRPQLARDGELVFFESRSNLTSGHVIQARQIYVHDRTTGTTELVSLSNSGMPGQNRSERVSPSADGRYAAFWARSPNLTSGPASYYHKIMVRDLLLGRTTWESRSIHQLSTTTCYNPKLSADGSTLLFTTRAAGVFPWDTYSPALFARSRDLGHLCELSRSPSGEHADGFCAASTLSAEGSRAVFETNADNLAPGAFGGWNVVAADFRLGIGEVICGGDGRFGPCPCGNTGSRGEGCENSRRMGARLDVDGSADLGLDNLELFGSNMPVHEPALLFSGVPGPVQPFGDGLLCVSGAITRIGVDQTNNHGEATWGDEMLSAAGAEFTLPVAFQAWYRDPQSPCGNGFNLTQAVMILPAH